MPDATESVKGKIQLATSAEATAGTDNTKAMTPLKTKSLIDANSSTLSNSDYIC